MKNILVQGYFVGNVGDDLFLKVLTEYFRDVSFTTFVDKKYLSIYKNFQNLTIITKSLSYKIINRCLYILKLPRLAKKLVQGYDAYVEIGGSIFQQNKSKQGVPLKRENIFETGTPYYIIGSNFGPFLNENYPKAYTEFFSKIAGITFRDTCSYNLFSNLKNVTFAPDVVFNLNSQKIGKHREEKPYITIVPIDLTNRKFSEEIRLEYERKLSELSQSFIKKGCLVKILAFNEYEGDLFAANRIASFLDQKKVEVVNYTSLNELLPIIKGSDKLISTRFHSMILGWIFQIPQVVIKYSPKMDNEIRDVFPNQTNFSLNSFCKANINVLTRNMNTINSLELEKNKDRSADHFRQLESFLRN
ncbi:polysaccharide pyruvyl transferase family protein [Ligilactobacillus acidipiscis]|uniref:polysaccharide pyruvyl transferase family protein n=1 Tax=Ligilactobacillus acidipiscis TaxID=89059 RepID=UPI0023F78DFA|nr:polysaccharide pyruvyl transferase family protein [Ligilactobacillus acidipiscis]WEV56540.1 polysaccharide pyruvyl transferase family protein [Ligilactobacillus acidipiscis]